MDSTNGLLCKGLSGKTVKLDCNGYASASCDTTGFNVLTTSLPCNLTGLNGKLTIDNNGLTSSGINQTINSSEVHTVTINACPPITSYSFIYNIDLSGNCSFSRAMPARCTALMDCHFYTASLISNVYQPIYPGFNQITQQTNGTVMGNLSSLTHVNGTLKVCCTYQTA